MKKTLLAFALLASLPGVAAAAALNLSWNDCGSFGQCNQSFACNTNTGMPFTLVGSFVPPAGITQLSGVSATVDVWVNAPDLPSWWAYRNTGACRQTALTATADFVSGPFSCQDYWQGQALGGVVSYVQPFLPGGPYPEQPNRRRITMDFAMPAAFIGPVDEFTEYFAFRMSLSLARSAGADACSGCSIPAAFWFNQLRLEQPGNPYGTTLQFAEGQPFASWQNGSMPVGDVGYGCPPTAARTSTWGAIKTLYH